MRLVLWLLETFVLVYLLVLFAPSFLGAPVPAPFDALNLVVPNVNFAGGLVYGGLSFVMRGIVLLLCVMLVMGIIHFIARRLSRR